MTFAYVRMIGAVAFAIGVAISPSHADEYPSRPVKIIVPFGAGGPTDIYARDIAAELQNSLHQPFIMENRPGAGGKFGGDNAQGVGGFLYDLRLAILAFTQIHIAPAKLVCTGGNVDKRLVIVIAQYG